ncbi:Aste57867_17858 [Aphanomyces stellatus]|uniref:Aste57867_17858 protein n=1 Tax=Aphanomyces stellatus TaxID=120398 RepID=A0A485L8M3_9STRA|nr:hypothetical protein As57867_017797 [Aphanomyces stellatus]VFT94601.1 Aste57867_17858 [Aphanomyces stellatus]
MARSRSTARHSEQEQSEEQERGRSRYCLRSSQKVTEQASTDRSASPPPATMTSADVARIKRHERMAKIQEKKQRGVTARRQEVDDQVRADEERRASERRARENEELMAQRRDSAEACFQEGRRLGSLAAERRKHLADARAAARLASAPVQDPAVIIPPSPELSNPVSPATSNATRSPTSSQTTRSLSSSPTHCAAQSPSRSSLDSVEAVFRRIEARMASIEGGVNESWEAVRRHDHLFDQMGAQLRAVDQLVDIVRSHDDNFREVRASLEGVHGFQAAALIFDRRLDQLDNHLSRIDREVRDRSVHERTRGDQLPQEGQLCNSRNTSSGKPCQLRRAACRFARHRESDIVRGQGYIACLALTKKGGECQNGLYSCPQTSHRIHREARIARLEAEETEREAEDML